MSTFGKVPIAGLATGVPGLDDILGGQGLPEYSFNLVAGPPGSGKTTLVQQIMFANATAERPAIFFTVLGEPTMKMMRYMQQLSFFDMNKIGEAVRFVNLSEAALTQDLDVVLDKIVEEVTTTQPALVIVDSFRTMMRSRNGASLHLEGFVQRLAQHLTTWQATTFLVGEYAKDELEENPVFTVADSLIWLWQSAERNSVVRKFQVGKMRGRSPTPGQHTFRITTDGIRIFPRKSHQHTATPPLARTGAETVSRQSMGIPLLDSMLEGGAPTGSSILIAGPAGSGKTVLSTHFMAAGLDRGETVVLAIFEESPDDYLTRADSFGFELSRYVSEGKLAVIDSRPLDLSVDETLYELRRAVTELGATRVVIDSLSGLELAVAAPFQQEYRESLYRLVGQLTRQGATVWMTCEVIESFADLKFTPHAISFLTDVIIVQRYIELDGRLKKMMSVIKMRRSPHSNELRSYEIGPRGIMLGEPLSGYRGVVTGIPKPAVDDVWQALSVSDTLVLQAIIAVGPSSREVLAGRTGLDDKSFRTALGRLRARGYVEEERTGAGAVVYRIGTIPSEG